MSSSVHRPRITSNGNRRMRSFHNMWCQTCRRSSRYTFLNPNENFCPHCFTILNHELLDIDIARRDDDSSSSPASRLLDSLALTLATPPPRQQYLEFERSRTRWDYEHGHSPWITLEFVGNANYENTNPRQAGATASAIEALRTVNITRQHMIKDSHCPVCKEEFEMGREVKELPCKHLYHCECIIPWLNMKNTCPVCRYVVRDEMEEYLRGENRELFGFEELGNSVNWVRDQLVSMWPFRVILDWNTRLSESSSSSTGRGNSWWRCWFII